jgi:hypothetical protein
MSDAEKRLYLIGTDHCTQYIYKQDSLNSKYRVRDFAAHLADEVSRLKIRVLAEELNEEAVTSKANCAIASNVQRLALGLGIAHVFCDPDSNQRKALGIPSTREIKEQLGMGTFLDSRATSLLEQEQRKYWTIREKYWLDCMDSRLEKKVLFVCGADHVERFEDLAARQGIHVEVLVKNWWTNSKSVIPD